VKNFKKSKWLLITILEIIIIPFLGESYHGKKLQSLMETLRMTVNDSLK